MQLLICYRSHHMLKYRSDLDDDDKGMSRTDNISCRQLLAQNLRVGLLRLVQLVSVAQDKYLCCQLAQS